MAKGRTIYVSVCPYILSIHLSVSLSSNLSLLCCFSGFIMPPTLKKLMGHIAFGASVSGCVGHTFCTHCNF